MVDEFWVGTPLTRRFAQAVRLPNLSENFAFWASTQSITNLSGAKSRKSGPQNGTPKTGTQLGFLPQKFALRLTGPQFLSVPNARPKWLVERRNPPQIKVYNPSWFQISFAGFTYTSFRYVYVYIYMRFRKGRNTVEVLWNDGHGFRSLQPSLENAPFVLLPLMKVWCF